MDFEKLLEVIQSLSPKQFVALAAAVSLVESYPREQIEDELLLLRRQIHDPLSQDVSLSSHTVFPDSQAE